MRAVDGKTRGLPARISTPYPREGMMNMGYAEADGDDG
jgi:hypothetical protein